jgi:hypothetical protein
MGSLLSLVITSFFMHDFEEEAFSGANNYKPICWFHYVDNMFIVWPHGPENLDNSHSYLNNIYPNIRFTMETELDIQLPFLDIDIYR